MKTGFFAALVLSAVIPMGVAMAQSENLEKKIWTLLDDSKAAYVSLPESDFRALGGGFDLPDGGRTVTALA